jgi:predicted glycosyltransferase
MPYQTRQRLELHTAYNPRLKVLSFVPDSEVLLERADRVVAMGGYNTVCEALSFGKSTLIVPRVHPRREQLIRAERMRDLGLLEVLHPSALNPQTLGEWLARDLPPRPPASQLLDLNGLNKLTSLLHDLLGSSAARAAYPRADKRCCHVAS